MEKIYKTTKKELKKIILKYSIDKNGNKVTKYKLSKNKKFLKELGIELNNIPVSTIQSWYTRLVDIEPYGIINDKFIFEYHKKITKLIKYNTNYLTWTKSKVINNISLKEKIKININWDEKKKYMALLKLNDSKFDIQKFKNLNIQDLKFLVDINIPIELQAKYEEEIENMLENGNTDIVEYIV